MSDKYTLCIRNNKSTLCNVTRNNNDNNKIHLVQISTVVTLKLLIFSNVILKLHLADFITTSVFKNYT